MSPRLRQGGADVFAASLGQGLFSDPIDKLITSFIVFIILSNLSSRYLARFPLGERSLTRPRPARNRDRRNPSRRIDEEDR